jgi:hypothetical protein
VADHPRCCSRGGLPASEKEVTVTMGESGGPGNVPAVPEVAVYLY